MDIDKTLVTKTISDLTKPIYKFRLNREKAFVWAAITATARSAQEDQEDNRRQGLVCSCAVPVERPSRRVESFGRSQNFYGTVENSLFLITPQLMTCSTLTQIFCIHIYVIFFI